MNKKYSDLLDVFRLPKPGPLPSAGPGTGPAERRTDVNTTPGVPVPPPMTPNHAGYGGAPDSVQITRDPTAGGTLHSEQMDALTRAQLRMPGLAHMGPPAPMIPQSAHLWDSLKTDKAFLYMDDAAVVCTTSGTITPATGTGAATAAVTMTGVTVGDVANQLSRYPGAISMHLFIRTFGWAPIATTATGAIIISFTDAFGGKQTVPLAALGASSGTDLTNVNTLCTSPVADAGATQLGTITVQSYTVATPVACAWFITFAFAYLIPVPALAGYSLRSPHLVGKS